MLKRTTKALLTLLVISLLTPNFTHSKEGMWQPSKLERQESDMQKLGLNIPIDKIYNTDGTGLNNAVAIFGRGCTSEMVSAKGLLFTNHHCAYGTIQDLSTTENNYLIDGFWAKNQSEELPCPGLQVKYVREMIDVSDEILKDLKSDLSEDDRNRKIKDRIEYLEKGYERIKGFDAEIKPFYNGNQYWVILTETFNDVRLVGTPPNGIGKFGADTDNWMWPRMTGDFAVFRVYASQDNKPAEYNESNVPYIPQAYFPISTAGVKEGDFTMVYGFPFQTQQYISSYQLELIEETINPIRIEARRERLAVIDEDMRNNPEIFLKYASKQSSISNGYKKWQGELQGLAINNVVDKKRTYEAYFETRAAVSQNEEDRLILTRIRAAVNGAKNAIAAQEYINETVMGVELIRQSQKLHQIISLYRNQNTPSEINAEINKIKSDLVQFYKNYNLPTDRKVFKALLPLYMKQDKNVKAPGLNNLLYNAGNSYDSWASSVFGNSILNNESNAINFLDNISIDDTFQIKNDPAFQIYETVYQFKKSTIDPVLTKYKSIMEPLNRNFIKKQMEFLNSGKSFYPDANQTLRLTYGQVEPIALPTSNIYKTTLNDLIPRHDEDIEEFNIPEPLRNLYLSKDYGQWEENGTVPINFIASNHTSGGNSGSPVLNGNGELIGINFDRIWQGTMSDLYFDPNLSRNISVDIKYILFIIEKYGKADWIIEELELVD